MYGIRSLQNGGPPIPRPRPEERARESLADYKQTPIQQRFLSPQDAETQTLIDSLLAEQQRGAEETELDMIIEQENEKFPDPLAVLGYQSGNIYGMPTELPGVVDPLGMTELKPDILRKLIEENPSLSPKQFIPPSNELSAYAEIGYKVNRDRTTGETRCVKPPEGGARLFFRPDPTGPRGPRDPRPPAPQPVSLVDFGSQGLGFTTEAPLD
jgi:hypothetical protein